MFHSYCYYKYRTYKSNGTFFFMYQLAHQPRIRISAHSLPDRSVTLWHFYLSLESKPSGSDQSVLTTCSTFVVLVMWSKISVLCSCFKLFTVLKCRKTSLWDSNLCTKWKRFLNCMTVVVVCCIERWPAFSALIAKHRLVYSLWVRRLLIAVVPNLFICGTT